VVDDVRGPLTAVSSWNLAEVWGVAAEERPHAEALVQGGRRLSWSGFDRRADGVAAALIDVVASRQGSVAQYLYLYNCPEYLESVYACCKAGLIPVNTNYRYAGDEHVSLWDDADVAAVVFHGCFSERIDGIRGRLPHVRGWLWVDDGTLPCPPWAIPYEEAAGAHRERTAQPWGRSPDDLFFLYTGGTTRLPKGVMWRQDDLFAVLNRTGELRYPEDGGLTDVRDILRRAEPGPVRLVPCPPLMHGTGAFTTFSVLDSAGSVILLEGRRIDDRRWQRRRPSG
jgi:acyl-CoA synthetase (AMP-forming)/AMP-acid ligase II